MAPRSGFTGVVRRLAQATCTQHAYRDGAVDYQQEKEASGEHGTCRHHSWSGPSPCCIQVRKLSRSSARPTHQYVPAGSPRAVLSGTPERCQPSPADKAVSDASPIAANASRLSPDDLGAGCWTDARFHEPVGRLSRGEFPPSACAVLARRARSLLLAADVPPTPRSPNASDGNQQARLRGGVAGQGGAIRRPDVKSVRVEGGPAGHGVPLEGRASILTSTLQMVDPPTGQSAQGLQPRDPGQGDPWRARHLEAEDERRAATA